MRGCLNALWMPGPWLSGNLANCKGSMRPVGPLHHTLPSHHTLPHTTRSLTPHAPSHRTLPHTTRSLPPPTLCAPCLCPGCASLCPAQPGSRSSAPSTAPVQYVVPCSAGALPHPAQGNVLWQCVVAMCCGHVLCQCVVAPGNVLWPCVEAVCCGDVLWRQAMCCAVLRRCATTSSARRLTWPRRSSTPGVST